MSLLLLEISTRMSMAMTKNMMRFEIILIILLQITVMIRRYDDANGGEQNVDQNSSFNIVNGVGWLWLIVIMGIAK